MGHPSEPSTSTQIDVTPDTLKQLLEKAFAGDEQAFQQFMQQRIELADKEPLAKYGGFASYVAARLRARVRGEEQLNTKQVCPGVFVHLAYCLREAPPLRKSERFDYAGLVKLLKHLALSEVVGAGAQAAILVIYTDTPNREEILNSKEFQSVLGNIQLLAGNKDKVAMWALGRLYVMGLVEPELSQVARGEKAEVLYKNAVELGSVNAMFCLALYNDHYQKEFDLAVELYQKAAALGNTYAMHNLAGLYRRGLVQVNLTNQTSRDQAARAPVIRNQEAVKLYKKAMALGDVHAMFCLAEMYLAARVESDLCKAAQDQAAVKLLQEAVVLDDACAMFRLAAMYLDGHVATNLDTHQQTQKAIELFYNSARQGQKEAYDRLEQLSKGNFYHQAQQSAKKALRNFLPGVVSQKNNDQDTANKMLARYLLGAIYQEKGDTAKAREYFSKIPRNVPLKLEYQGKIAAFFALPTAQAGNNHAGKEPASPFWSTESAPNNGIEVAAPDKHNDNSYTLP